jgi:hypothetical protein
VDGIVSRWIETEAGSFGRILAEGLTYRVSGRDVSLDCLGRCFLQKDEPVIFIPERRATTRGNRWYAKSVTRPWAERNIDPETHREICKVLDVDWIIRQLGGRLLLDRDEPEFDFLRAGQIVCCGVRSPCRGNTWVAVDIRILAADESSFDWNSEEAQLRNT